MADGRDIFTGVKTTLGLKAPVYAAVFSNLTLAGIQDVDGFAGADGVRVLAGGQTDPSENGIYNMRDGTWERAKDFDKRNDFVRGTLIAVANRQSSAAMYMVEVGPVNIDVDDITFSVAAFAANTGLPGFVINGTYPEDQTDQIQVMLDAMAAVAVSATDGNGYRLQTIGTFGISGKITVPAAMRGLIWEGGQFICALDGDWTETTYAIEVAGRRCTVQNINIDCNHVCAGIGNTGGQNVIRFNRVQKQTTYAYHAAGTVGGTQWIGNRAQQWPSVTAEELANINSRYDADGVCLETGDDKFFYNILSDNGCNFRAKADASSTLISGNHLFNGGQFVTRTVTSITQGNPGVITAPSHGLENGTVIIFNVSGMTQLNGNRYRAASVTTDTFALDDTDGDPVDTSGFSAFTSGTVRGIRTSPKNIICEYAAGGMEFADNYIGNGEIDLYTDNVVFDNNFGLNITNNAFLEYWCALFGQPGVNHPSSFRWRNWRFGSSVVNSGEVPQLVLRPNEDNDEYDDDWSVLAPAGINAWQYLALQDRIAIGRPYDNDFPVVTFISPNQDNDGTTVAFVDSDTTDPEDAPRLGSRGDRLQMQAPQQLVLRLSATEGDSARMDFEDPTSSTNPYIESVGNEMNIRGVAGIRFINVTNVVPDLDTNRDASFAFTSNTNLRIAFRGNDGVTRVADITLA